MKRGNLNELISQKLSSHHSAWRAGITASGIRSSSQMLDHLDEIKVLTHYIRGRFPEFTYTSRAFIGLHDSLVSISNELQKVTIRPNPYTLLYEVKIRK